MSNALAFAGVTLTLRALLQNALTENNVPSILGSATVTAQAPSRIVVGASEAPLLNLFLYNLSANTGWSTQYLPSHNGQGERLTNQPLALNLHYAVSAYGNADFVQDILLGFAVQALHEIPVLGRDRIRAELQTAGASASQIMQAIADADLPTQIETLKITPVYMNSEELSRLWSTFQAPYRPTATYMLSVVLIESQQATHYTPPVLRRNMAVQADILPPYPKLYEVIPPDGQPSAELGDVLTLHGKNLSGTNVGVIFDHPKLPAPIEVAPTTVTDETITMTLPNNAVDWAAGMTAVSVMVVRPTEIARRQSDIAAFTIAPRISVNAIRAGQDVTFTITVAPVVRAEQQITFAIGLREVVIAAPNAPTATLQVIVTGIDAGTYIARLRVDGVDSQFIDRTVEPPAFIAAQRVTVP